MRSTEHYYTICGSDDREAWLAARTSGIGSSDMAAVLDESPFRSAYGLWLEKTGQVEPQSDAEHLYWGRALEAAIIDGYAHRSGRPAKKAGYLLRSRAYPWATCTLDGWTKRTPDAVWTQLEAKNVIQYQADAWADGPPEHYRIQIHHQMLVTGSEVATWAALIGGRQLIWDDMPRDEALIRRIIAAGERFWERVQDGEAPPVAATRACGKDIAAAYPTDDGAEVVLPDDLDLEIARMKDLESQARDLKKQIDAVKNTVKAAMGSAAVGVTPGGARVTWKTYERGPTYQPAKTVRTLRIKAA